MVYADYEYYITEYLGSAVPVDAFPAAAFRASRFLDYYTMNRARAVPDMKEVKMACCALAEEAYAATESEARAMQAALSDEGGKLQSETVGSYSVTYRSAGQQSDELLKLAQASRERMADTARQYLAHTGLLYRGGGCRCTRRIL